MFVLLIHALDENPLAIRQTYYSHCFSICVSVCCENRNKRQCCKMHWLIIEEGFTTRHVKPRKRNIDVDIIVLTLFFFLISVLQPETQDKKQLEARRHRGLDQTKPEETSPAPRLCVLHQPSRHHHNWHRPGGISGRPECQHARCLSAHPETRS